MDFVCYKYSNEGDALNKLGISFEDEVLKRGEKISGAHTAVLEYFYEQLDWVPVHSFVVVLYKLDSNDLLQKDVDLSTSVASEVIVMHHLHELFITDLVYVPCYLCDQRLADLLLYWLAFLL